jgi:FMN phosphatase YigB (HAD superfamily)
MSHLNWITDKIALLLDMNGTFMFGQDRFSKDCNYHDYYRSVGGTLGKQQVNQSIEAAYNYLDVRYPQAAYRYAFPSIEAALKATCGLPIVEDEVELERLIKTFTYHELGHISEAYVLALKSLAQRYTLGLVADIWAPKQSWVNLFEQTGISACFSACSFSSDHGIVKPAKEPFEMVIQQLGIEKNQALVIGDCPRRDLGGAVAAGMDCVLVGGATHDKARYACSSLLQLSDQV